MAGGLIGALRVTLGIDASQFENGAKGATRRAKQMQRDFESVGKGITKAGQVLSVGLTLPFVALMRSAIPAAKESREAMGQVNAALEHMGPAAHRTSEQLQLAAKELMHISTFDDDDILRSVTANLLTFGNIAGAQFDRAQKAAVDLATRMHMDLQPATLMLGKALNDPAKGLAALRRVGIQFTTEQQKMIAGMVKHKDIAGAQNVMLKELERQFGGSAEAMRAAQPDQAFINDWDDFKETIGEIALKIMPALTAVLDKALAWFQQLSPEAQKFAVYAAAIAAALGPVLMIFGPIVSAMGKLFPLLASTSSVMGAVSAAGGGLVGILGAIASALLPLIAAAGAAYLVWKNWDTILPILQNFWAWIQKVFGPPIMAAIAEVSSSLQELWSGPFGTLLRGVGQALLVLGGILVKVLGPPLIAILRGIAPIFSTTFKIIGDVLNVLSAILMGDFSGAWAYAKKTVNDAIHGIGNVIETMVPGALNWLSQLYHGAKTWLVDKFNTLAQLALQPIRTIANGFKWLYDVVVGHSYVPDMVDGIASQMGRLEAEMAEPVRRSTKGASKAMKEMADTAFKAAKKSFDAMKKLRDDLKSLLDELFPEAAALRKLYDDLGTLDKARKAKLITPAQYEEAVRRAKRSGIDETPDYELLSDYLKSDHNDITPMDDPHWEQQAADELERFSGKRMDQIALALENKTTKIAQSFVDMANSVLDSVKSMIDAFKGGNFLDILESVLGLVTKVLQGINGAKSNGGGIMGFLAAFGGRTGAPGGYSGSGFDPGGTATGFSTGASFKVGGSGGVDSQLMRFRATPGEIINVSRGDLARRPDAVVVYVKRGEMFDAEVHRISKPLADDAAARGAAGGAFMAQRARLRMDRGKLA